MFFFYFFFFFFFNDTATTEIYTLSLHDALPISAVVEHDCGHPQQVREVRNAALLAVLIAMHLGRKQQRVIESYGERDKRFRHCLTLRAWHKRTVRRLSGYRKLGGWRSADWRSNEKRS